MEWSRLGSKFILNITLVNGIMWNVVRCMWIINRVTMVTNYCDLMIILTHLNLCHQCIVNSSQLKDNMYSRYLQAVIPLLDILAHYSIEITIHSYLIFLTLFSGKWLTTLMYILYMCHLLSWVTCILLWGNHMERELWQRSELLHYFLQDMATIICSISSI